MRRHRLPLGSAFDLARLGIEASVVVGLRAAKLAAGGPAALLEVQRMTVERRRLCLRRKLLLEWR